MQLQFDHNGNTVSCEVLGDGGDVWIAFPGYGRPASDFRVWSADAVALGIRLVCVDLPYQGDTLLAEPRQLPVDEVCAWIDKIRERMQVQHVGLIGYSIGGRVALTLAGCIPSIKGLVLIAPDGLRSMFWNRLATHPGPARMLFKATLRRPAWFFMMVRLAAWLGLIRPSVKKFLDLQLNSMKKRKMLDDVWCTLMPFEPDLQQVRELVREGLACYLVFGTRDRIIPARLARYLPEAKVILLEEGHDLIKSGVFGQLPEFRKK